MDITWTVVKEQFLGNAKWRAKFIKGGDKDGFDPETLREHVIMGMNFPVRGDGVVVEPGGRARWSGMMVGLIVLFVQMALVGLGVLVAFGLCGGGRGRCHRRGAAAAARRLSAEAWNLISVRFCCARCGVAMDAAFAVPAAPAGDPPSADAGPLGPVQEGHPLH
jgi:hypothetical protein